jgi:hypothetical protein
MVFSVGAKRFQIREASRRPRYRFVESFGRLLVWETNAGGIEQIQSLSPNVSALTR